MNLNIIKIGNLKGIIIPSSILKKCNISNFVKLYVKEGKIIIEAMETPRKNWKSEFIKMNQNNDDKLIIPLKLSMLYNRIY